MTPPDFVTGFMTIDSIVGGRPNLLTDALRHMILPATVLAVPSMSIIVRVVRTTMLDILSQDYIRMARAKGMSSVRL